MSDDSNNANHSSGDREREIFRVATELTPGPERDACLDRMCAGDEALRSAVVELLEQHDRSGGFMARPAMGEPPAASRVVADFTLTNTSTNAEPNNTKPAGAEP